MGRFASDTGLGDDGLVVAAVAGAGLAAAHSGTWATGLTTAIAVLVTLQQVVGRWRR